MATAAISLGQFIKALDRIRADNTGQATSITAALDVAVANTKVILITGTPTAVIGARDDPEEALANVLAFMATLGLITNSTTAT